ncbi:MAG: hypothetical protein ACRELW_23940 [Candidatus Rokuibacteriota bacterium]
MLTVDRHGAGLELEDDEAFHQRVWRLKRAGRLAMLLLVLMGLGGLLGASPLSRTAVQDAEGLRVEYARFARAEAPESIQVRMPARAADVYRLAVSREFLDRVRVDSVVPAPVLAEALADRVVYVFAGRPSTGSVVATFHVTPDSVGLVRASFGVPGAPSTIRPLAIWMVVYP